MSINKITNQLVIFGTGEIGELAYYYFTHDSPYDVVAFSADKSCIKESTFHDLPIIPFEEVEVVYPPSLCNMFIALSYARLNQIRQKKYEEACNKGYKMASYISSKSACWGVGAIGDNCFILENQTIQPYVRIGNNVTLWSGNHIGHHSTIADHTFIASQVVVSGNCKIGSRCFVGVNATLRDGVTIADDCFVGMAASVVGDMQAGSVALAPSGEILLKEDRRARALKRRYFGI